MHRAVLSVAVATVLLSSTAGGVPANEAPLADAGLDQSAEAGESVRLDATGSRDPDGTISSYEWEVEHPNGTTTTLDCTDCATPTFTPTRGGQYNLTVTVTDDDGATRSDTLYLTVTDTGSESDSEGPSVTLSGAENPIVGQVMTYTATATAGDALLEEMTLFIDGRRINRWRVGGTTETVEQDYGFAYRTARRLRVNVTDTAGRTATETLRITPRLANAERSGSGGGADPGDYFDPNADGGQGAWVDTRYNENGNMVVANQEGRTEADAQNYVLNNGVASNTYSNPGPNPTTSEVGAVAQTIPLPLTSDGDDSDSGGSDSGSSDSTKSGNEGGGIDRDGNDGGGGSGGLDIGGIDIGIL